MSFLIDVLNGVQKLVSATPAAVGAEPALGDPGPGTWYLRSIGAVRSWVAQVPWAGVDKTGAVASDVGAEPALGNPGPGTWFLKTISGVRSWVASIPWAGVDKTGAVATDVGALASLTLGGDVDANSINAGASCVVKFQGVTSWTNFPFANPLLMSGKGGVFTQLSGKDSGISQCWTDLTDGGTYRRNYVTAYGWSPWYTDWDSYNLPVGSTGKALLATASQAAARSAISALPVANPTATGTLTAPDVVVSSMAGTGLRTVAADSTGKLVQNGAPILVLTDAGIVLAGTWAPLLANDADTRYRISANTAYAGMRIRLTSFGRHTISASGSIVHEVFIGPYGTTVAPYYANATNDTVAKTAFTSGTIDYQTVVEIIFTAIGGSGSALVRTETKFTQAGFFNPVISTTSEAITVDTTIDRWINLRGGNTSITSTYNALERFSLVP